MTVLHAGLRLFHRRRLQVFDKRLLQKRGTNENIISEIGPDGRPGAWRPAEGIRTCTAYCVVYSSRAGGLRRYAGLAESVCIFRCRLVGRGTAAGSEVRD